MEKIPQSCPNTRIFHSNNIIFSIYEVNLNICNTFYAPPPQFIDKSSKTIEIVNVTKIYKSFEELSGKKKQMPPTIPL